MKQETTEKGYKRVMIVLDGKSYNKFVHCIVASAFPEICGIPKGNDWQVHHKNNNSTDNNSSNLQWVSRVEHHKIHNQKKGNIKNE